MFAMQAQEETSRGVEVYLAVAAVYLLLTTLLLLSTLPSSTNAQSPNATPKYETEFAAFRKADSQPNLRPGSIVFTGSCMLVRYLLGHWTKIELVKEEPAVI